MKKIVYIMAMFALLGGVVACNDENDTPNPQQPEIDVPVDSTTVTPDDSGIDGFLGSLEFKEEMFEYPYTVEFEKENDIPTYIFTIPAKEISTVLYTKAGIVQEVSYVRVNGEKVPFENIFETVYKNHQVCVRAVCDYGEFDFSKGNKLHIKLFKNDLQVERCIEFGVYGVSSISTLKFIQAAE